MAEFRVQNVLSSAETILSEGLRPADSPVTRVAVATVFENPWLRLPDTRDLGPVIADYVLSMVPDPDAILSYGKAALVGVEGETEHASSLMHNPYFGAIMRDRFRGTEYVSFSDFRVRPGYPLLIPMKHKSQGELRDYFQTAALSLSDAPAPHELVLAMAVSTGPRPRARSGDRTTDVAVDLAEFESFRPKKQLLPAGIA